VKEAVAKGAETATEGLGIAHHEVTGAAKEAPAGTMVLEIAAGATEGEGWVHVKGRGTCPDGYPIKGNLQSMIYHMPDDTSYRATIPEVCFTREADAVRNGFRSTKRRAARLA